jgi:hypothetical protein
MRRQFLEEMRIDPCAESMNGEDLEFSVIYMIGGMMQVVEYYLFDNKDILTTQELADKIAFLEEKIREG